MSAKAFCGLLHKYLFAAAQLLFAASAVAQEVNINFDGGPAPAKSFMQAALVVDTALPPVPAAASLKKWTVMVYVNGRNNLEYWGLTDVNEMETVGSSPDVNVVVELGRTTSYAVSDGDWAGSRRYLIWKDDDPYHIASPVLQEIPQPDMGDWKHLVEFGGWAKQNFPAQHYMLIVWNHGSGWNKLLKADTLKGISYDYDTKNHISTPQLAQALAAIGKVDVYASDACLMQMAEVDYEIRKAADYIVGSEESEPGEGFTYDALLNPLVNRPGMTAEDLGRLAVNSYADHYQPLNKGTTMSLVRTSALPALLSNASAFADAVMNSNALEAAKKARTEARKFYFPYDKDLYDFVRLAMSYVQTPEVSGAGKKLLAFLERDLVIYHRYTGEKYVNTHGLSVYLPDDKYNPNYDELAWSKAGSWNEFVNWLLTPPPPAPAFAK